MSCTARSNPLRALVAGLVLAALGCGGLRGPARRTVEIVGGQTASRMLEPYCFEDALRDAGRPPAVDGVRHQTEISGELRGPLQLGPRELLIIAAVSVPAALMCAARPAGPADPNPGGLALDLQLRRQ